MSKSIITESKQKNNIIFLHFVSIIKKVTTQPPEDE